MMESNLNSIHIKNILKHEELKKEFLDNCSISEDELTNFDNLSNKNKEEVLVAAIYVLDNGWARHLLTFNHPDEMHPSLLTVYGEDGIYLVIGTDFIKGHTFFTSENDALKFANASYDEFLRIYKEDIDPDWDIEE